MMLWSVPRPFSCSRPEAELDACVGRPVGHVELPSLPVSVLTFAMPNSHPEGPLTMIARARAMSGSSAGDVEAGVWALRQQNGLWWFHHRPRPSGAKRRGRRTSTIADCADNSYAASLASVLS